jgi:hypothetical protein
MPSNLTNLPDVKMPDADWFLEHREQLEAQYGMDWIGIKGGRVVGHASTAAELHRIIRAQGLHRVLVTRAHADAWQSYK